MKLTFVHSMWGTGRPTTFESCLKNSRGGEMHVSHRGVQVEPDTACVCVQMRNQMRWGNRAASMRASWGAAAASWPIAALQAWVETRLLCVRAGAAGSWTASGMRRLVQTWLVEKQNRFLSKCFFITAGEQMKRLESRRLQAAIRSSVFMLCFFLQLVTVSVIT